jgi:hypothetical protein
MKLNIKKLVKQLGIIFSVALVLTLIFSHVLLVEAIVVSAILAVIGMVVGHTACWLFRWKRLKWILVGLGCLLALSVVVLVEENIRTKHNWNVHRSVLQQKGENFNLSHFVPPTIPDDQNFTMTPLLKPIMEFKHTKNGVVWLDTNASAKVSNLRSELQSKGITNNSKAGSIERGTFADLKTYQEFYKGNTNYYQPTTPGPAGEDILIALSKFDSELNELKEAMKTRPLAKWNVRYTDGDSVFAILLPHLGHIKGLVVFCQIHGIAAADAGLSQMALEDFLVALRLSDSVKNTPILIDHLVRLATLNLTIQGIRDGLYRHTWNSEQLLELEKQLASIDLLSEAKVSLRGERVMSILGIEQIRTGTVDTKEIGMGVSLQKLPRLVSCVFYQNMLTVSELHQEMIDLSIDEKQHLVFTNQMPTMREFQKQRKTPYNMLAGLLMPAYERVTIKVARVQTMVDAARTACALERYRLEHGTFPDSLTNGPMDVMDGKPLRYRKTSDGGYVLYSIGWNGVDDGGVTGFKKNRETGKESPDAETGDWVWFMPKK